MKRLLAPSVTVFAVVLGLAAAPIVLDALHVPTCHVRAQTDACLPIQATNTSLELTNLRLRMTIEALSAPTTPTSDTPATAAAPTATAIIGGAGTPTPDLVAQRIVVAGGTTLDVLIPRGWSRVSEGVYAPSATSLDVIVYTTALPTVRETVQLLSNALNLRFEAPTGRHDTGALAFTIYETMDDSDGTRQLIAIAPATPVGVVVLVQTTSDKLEAFRTGLFLPALTALTIR